MRFPGFSLHQFFVRLHFYCFSQFLEFLLAVKFVNALFFVSLSVYFESWAEKSSSCMRYI